MRHLRRRGVLLGGLVAVLALVTLSGPWTLWPLFVVPVVLSLPLAGLSGLGATLMATALVFALLSDRGASGPELAAGLLAFAVAAAAARLALSRGEHEAAAVPERSAPPGAADGGDLLTRRCRRVDRHGGALSLVALGVDDAAAFQRRNGLGALDRLVAALEAQIAASTEAATVPVRLGPDAFAVLVDGSVQDADQIAERLRDALESVRVPVPGGRVEGVMVVTGVAGYLPGTGHGDDLLADARTALAAARARESARASEQVRVGRWDTGRLPRVSAA